MTKNYNSRLFNIRKLALVTLCILGITTSASAQTYVPVPYYTGFESGSLGTEWTATSSQAGTNIEVIQTGILAWGGVTADSYAGQYFLGLDYGTGGVYNLNQADLHLNTAGSSNLRMSFQWAEWNDETEAQDGVYISDNGGTTFVKVLDLNGASYTDLVYYQFDMSLDSINTVHGLSFTSQYVIRLQQYDNYYFAGGNDGHLYDEFEVYQACATSSSIAVTECSSYTVPSGNATYTSTGIYYDTLTNSALCDSIITIDLTIQTLTTLNITETVCDSYTSPTGMMYTSSGNYTETLTSVQGCDSVVYNIDLTVNTNQTSTISESVCEPYLSPAGNTYSTSGIYNDTISTMGGCDSIIVIDLTVNSPTSASITETVLDSYTAPSGAVYTTSGIYMDTIANAAGCDSVITIDLTVEYTGLEEMDQHLISCHPNPVSNTLNVSGLDQLSEIQEIVILDMKGRLVTTLKSTDSSFEVGALESGSYFLVVRHNSGTEQLKFIKL